MRLSRIGVAAGLLPVIGMISITAVLTAAKPAPPVPTAATVTFRCDGAVGAAPCGDPSVATNDRVRADDVAYSTGTIGSTGMYLVRLTPTSTAGRWLNLYFYDPGSRPCAVAGNCNPDGPLYQKPQPMALDDIELRTKPLVNGTWDDLPGGLFAIACGGTSPGMVHFTFWLPTGNGHWGLNFNPRSASGSSPVSIRRIAFNQWTVSAAQGDLGGLLSWNHSGLRGRNGPSVEGLFTAPFLFTIDATGSVPGNGSCTP